MHDTVALLFWKVTKVDYAVFLCSMNERLEAVVSGRVQMVMYRDFAQRKARRLKLVGEVQNLPNKTVRVIAEGPRVALDGYVEKLKKGSFLSDVEEVKTVWLPAANTYSKFDINYD